jgi:hypothetical protein
MRSESADAEEARCKRFAAELSKVFRIRVKEVRDLAAAVRHGLEADVSGDIRNSSPA